MNQLAHILIAYVLGSFFFPVQEYLLPIAIFSIILDLDHLPGYIIVLKEKKKRSVKEYVELFRTQVQEPIGIMMILVILGLLYFFGVQDPLLGIAAFCIFLHWLVDFLTVHTRPLDPFNKKIISLFFHTKKQRLWSEIVITGGFLLLAAGVFFI